MPLFETSVTLACTQEQAFDFLLRPANVARISPPELGLNFVNAPEVLQVGSRLEFKVQGWGQVQTMIHEITAVVRPTQITEIQVKGLFAKWVHDHRLHTDAEGHVVVIDSIEFEPPGGLLGFLVTKHKIIEYLEDGYDYRHQQMKKLLTP